MVNLLIFFLSINSMNIEQQEPLLKVRLTLMYRRSGQTALTYRTLSSGDTVHYYERRGNPYFRVYQFKFNKGNIIANQMTVESYLNNSLLKTTELKSRTQAQYVDTYVDEKEDLIKITVHYFDRITKEDESFILFIIPDKNWQ